MSKINCFNNTNLQTTFNNFSKTEQFEENAAVKTIETAYSSLLVELNAIKEELGLPLEESSINASEIRFQVSEVIQKPLRDLNPLVDKLKQTGLANEVFQLSNAEIEAKLVELGVDANVAKQVAESRTGYYSNASTALENLKDKNVKNVQGWMKALTDVQKNGGIKNVNQELEWIGLEDYLTSYVKENNPKAGNIPSSVVEDYIKSNQIEIVEVSKGESPSEDEMENAGFTISEGGFGEVILKLDGKEITSESDERLNNYQRDLLKRYYGASPTKYSGYQLKGADAPLAKDTEILTDKGWISIEDVSIGDNVLTRRDIDGVVEYKPVQAKPEVYSEFLYKYESPSIYLETTAKHTMVVERPRGSGNNYRWETERVATEDLWKLPNRRIPLTGIWNGESVENIYGYNSVDIAEFMGWYIAEGHCVHDKVTNNKSTVCIAQKKSVNKEKCERLEKLFNRLGFNWSYCADNHYYISCKNLTKELKDVLYGMPKSLGKEIPKELLKMDKTIMNSLLSGLILGDGCITPSQEGRKERKTYHTASFKLASDVQTLATLLGYASTITKRDKNYKNTLYAVSFKESKYCWVDNVKKEIIPYNDVAYCVTVENHAIYVRKNGRAVFTGNSTYREVLLTMPSKVIENDKVFTVKSRRDFWKDASNFSAEEVEKGFVVRSVRGGQILLEKGYYIKTKEDAINYYREDNLQLLDIFVEEQGVEDYDFYDENGEYFNTITAKNIGQATTQYRERTATKGEEYSSNHWSEKNVLAHVRLNEKTLPDGRRVLIVNEVQSDISQDLKKEQDKILDRVDKEFDNFLDNLIRNNVIIEEC
jgi:uncharacterized protein YidB (DUF937 family)